MPLPKLGAPSNGSSGLPKLPPGDYESVVTSDSAETDEGTNWGPLAVGGGLLAGAAALATRGRGLGKILKPLMAVRSQSMLSGMALPKSIAGNIGSSLEASFETKSLKPLKAMLSRQTLTDAKAAYKANAGALPGQVNLPGPMPGRMMGAVDTAAQKALIRAGFSAKEAERRVLQAPLGGKLGKALESPVAQYVHPFRRTPFNQFIEGWQKMSDAAKGDKTALRGVQLAGMTGAAHGAATEDDNLPMSIPFMIAALPQYGLTYGLGALAGRTMAGGNTGGSGIAGSMLPVSEYGVEASVDPARIIPKPAAITALERLFGGS